jgi:hypothetical protein
VVDRLAKDLKAAFPDLTGFSARNMRYMKALAEAYPDEAILQRSVAILPWRHNIVLLEKLKDQEQRLWYAVQASGNGWSQDILAMQIDSNLFRRQGGAVTNFDLTIPVHARSHPLPFQKSDDRGVYSTGYEPTDRGCDSPDREGVT